MITRPPTHLFHGQWPVTVAPGPDEHTVHVTYVGPAVPGNRKLGDVRLASRVNIFTGKPTLMLLCFGPGYDPVSRDDVVDVMLANLGDCTSTMALAATLGASPDDELDYSVCDDHTPDDEGDEHG